MSYWMSIILGLVQGITEFLPVSSSGHLSIIQNIFRVDYAAENNLLFDVLLHVGTLAAVFIVYWNDIRSMVSEALIFVRGQDDEESNGGRLSVSVRNAIFIVVGTLPLVLVLPFYSEVEKLFSNTIFIAFALVVTGTLLFVAGKLQDGRKNERTSTIADAFVVGLAQAVAVIPGLSRSGATITVGLARGFRRSYAVKFAFLLSIPAVVGSTFISLLDAIRAGIDWGSLPVYIVGMVVAGVSGYFALLFLRKTVESKGLNSFAYYCWGAGVVAFILGMVL